MYGMASGPRYGTIIRRGRLRKLWTQRQLAAAVSVSVRAVNDWENNRSFPRNPVAVEDALGISLAEEATALTDAERKELMKEYQRLQEDYERVGKLLGKPGGAEQEREPGERGGNVHDEQGRSA